MQAENQKGVQRQVHDRPQQRGHHAHLSEALGVDEGIHPQPDHHRNHARQVDLQIASGVNHGAVAAPHQVEEGRLEQVKARRQRRAQQEQQGEADPHDPGRLLVLSPSPGDGEQRRAAGAAQIGKGGDDVGGRHHQPDAGEGVPADGVNMADERSVHHII